jgi:hypothetical protein
VLLVEFSSALLLIPGIPCFGQLSVELLNLVIDKEP